MSNLSSLGTPIWLSDNLYEALGAPAFASGMLIDAVAEKVAMYGCVWHPTVKTGTINIRKIHFRAGAVTLGVSSVVRVSLQNVSATAGPPYQPDGSQDETVDMTTITANAWNTTAALSADRAVDLSADSLGDTNSRWLCIVFEYQTFTAADSVVISAFRPRGSANAGNNQVGSACLLNTGSWAITANPDAPNVVLECDDGTFAFLLGGHAIATIPSAISVSSNGAIRRAGMKFKLPVQVKISRLGLGISGIPDGSDGRLVLYDTDGTTELVSVDIDNDAVIAVNNPGMAEVAFSPVTLLANTFYRCAFVGGTTTAATIHAFTVNAVGHMACYPLGANAMYTQHDGTVWADTTTQRCSFKLGLESVHDGVSQGMTGGRRRR